MAENTNTVFNEEQLKKWESQMSRILDNMAEGSERLINHTDRLLEHYRRSAENNFGYVDKAIKKIYESLADAEVSLKREKVNLINTVNAAAKEITNKEDRIATQEEMQIISRLLSLEAKRKEQEKSGLDTTEIRRLISKEKGEYNSKGYGTAVQISEKESVRENFEVVNKKETELSVLNDEAEKANEKMDETQKKAENLTKNITNFIEEVWHQIKGGAEMWMKYNDQAVAVGRRMGMSYKATLGYQQSLMANSKDLIRNYGMTADQAMKMQESFQEATGKASFLTKSQLNDVAASSKLMGEETVNGAITAMDKLGGGTEQATEILDKTFARAQNAGLDTNKTAKDLVANLEYANKLSFRTGVDGISRMTVLSERMKMNFGEVAKVADKFSTIEGAIQGSAQLQMLGGQYAAFGANPMEMMYEATSDPEALQQRMIKMFSSQASFNRKTGESEIDPVQMEMMRAAAKGMGMDADEAVKSAKQQARIGSIDQQIKESGIGNRLRLTEDNKAALENKAHYDTASQTWKVNYLDQNGQQHDVNMDRLTTTDMKEIMKDNLDPQKDIQQNVRQMAHDLVTMREAITGVKEAYDTAKGELLNTPMKAADSVTKFGLQNKLMNPIYAGGFGTAVAMLGISAAMVAKMKYQNRILGGLVNFLNPTQSRLPSKMPEVGVETEGLAVGKPPVTPGPATPGPATPGPGTGVNAEAAAAAPKATAGKPYIKPTITETVKAAEIPEGGAAATVAEDASKMSRWGKFYKIAGGKAGLIGGGLGIAAAGVTAGIDIVNANTAYNERYNRLQTLRFKNSNEKEALEQKARLERNEKRGGAVGEAVGGLAGAAIGSAILPGIGTFVGSFIGAQLGKKFGKSMGGDMTDTDSKDVINKHLGEINKSNEKENLRRIVLPVENIDNNIAHIANRLGVQAEAARGNIYNEESVTPNQNNNAEAVSNVTAYNVAPVDNNTAATSQTISFNPMKMNLNINGSLNLKLNGANLGKINQKELMGIIDSPIFRSELTKVIVKQMNMNVTTGRGSKDSIAFYEGGGTDSLYTSTGKIG